MRSAISNSSSRSWLITSTALPCVARSTSAWRISARRAGIDAPGRLVDDEQPRLADDLAADDEFLQVAAGELARRRIALGHAHVEGLDDVAREPPGRVERDEARRASPPGGRVGEQGVLAQAMGRRGRVAEALLRHEGGAEPPAGIDAEMPQAWPAMRIASGRGRGARPRAPRRARSGRCRQRPRCRRSRPHATASSMSLSALPCRVAGRGRGRDPQHLGRATGAPCATSPTSTRADHQGGDLAALSLARIERRDHLAAPQDRRAAAEAADLLELVRDVEDRAALGREPLERHEQLSASCGVSTEVGSSRIRSFGFLQQAADDLDALPLAGRERPDRAVGIEREAVGG